jgi:signal transduction histidine kinase/CheY-like chemotaxis protein
LGGDPARVVGIVAAARDITKWVLAAEEREKTLTELQESNRRLEETLAELRATQEKMMEQERLAAVGQLAAGIAHDFNNMMASITLYADLMLTTSTLSPTDRDRIKTIRQEGWRAADLTQQMLDFGRRSLLRREEVDLAPFVKGMERLLESTLAGSGQLLMSYGAGEMVVDVDRDRLRQVLLNLTLNAREAMAPKGGGALRIGLERVPASFVEDLSDEEVGDTDWIELTVADTGAGIPDDVMPHIFEPFFTTRSPMGSGLGLSQVYGIVKQHDGHIEVNTVLGQGTIFTIYLPALPSSEPAAPSWEATEVRRGEGETILVVESSSIMRQALEECLEMLNYRVLTATGRREALNLLEQHQGEFVPGTAETARPGIALALISLATYGLQGLDWYVGSSGERPPVPVVVISDYPMRETAEQLAAARVVGWLRKPVNLDRIADTVAQALEGGPAGGRSDASEAQTVSPDEDS